MEPSFLDTNILIRHITQDEPDHSPRATSLLRRVEAGQIEVHTADTVIFETVFTLQRTYRIPREQIRNSLLPLIELSGVILPGKQHFREVFDWYVGTALSFADAYHAVLVRRLGLDQVLSFDRDFDHVPWLKRVEP